jgi:hypothetical protein
MAANSSDDAITCGQLALRELPCRKTTKYRKQKSAALSGSPFSADVETAVLEPLGFRSDSAAAEGSRSYIFERKIQT